MGFDKKDDNKRTKVYNERQRTFRRSESFAVRRFLRRHTLGGPGGSHPRRRTGTGLPGFIGPTQDSLDSRDVEGL